MVSWSRHLDDLTADGGPEAIRTRREVEAQTMRLVLCPGVIADAWRAGEFGPLGYLAEAFATWPDACPTDGDAGLRRNVERGLAKARQTGWAERLDAGWLHLLEGLLCDVLTNQRAEGIVLASGEVSEVRQRLAREHISKSAC